MPFNIGTITDVVVVILALSAASERLVAIIKGLFKWLSDPDPVTERERWRVWSLRVISVIAGIATAALASGFLFENQVNWFGVVGLGLLASGGSDLWNSVLGYLNAIKDEVKADAKTKLARAPGIGTPSAARGRSAM